MSNDKKLHVKIGDNVKIISGFDKNKVGEVTKIYRNTGKILVMEFPHHEQDFFGKNSTTLFCKIFDSNEDLQKFLQ